LIWLKYFVERPIEHEDTIARLTLLAAHLPVQTPLVFEARSGIMRGL
jgi:hypothetical protein